MSRTRPRIIWLSGRPMGFARGRDRKQRLLLQGARKISHAPSPSTGAVIWEDWGSDPLAHLESIRERQEATRSPPGIDGSNNLGEHMDPRAGRHPLGLLSSLLNPGPYLPASRLAPALGSLWPHKVAPGPSPTHGKARGWCANQGSAVSCLEDQPRPPGGAQGAAQRSGPGWSVLPAAAGRLPRKAPFPR